MKLTFAIKRVIPKTEKSIRNQIWDILCECDKEFVPPLSARESSTQSTLSSSEGQDIKPFSYFEKMTEQHFILAIDEEKNHVIGFMTFKSNYYTEELKNYSPSNYITTICIKRDYRNYGITRKLYQFMKDDIKQQGLEEPYLTTRTWSSNDAHIHILKSLQFDTVERLKDHRGPGVDTLYFGRKVSERTKN
ncbi:GNAT family N-acetyltransferase [Aquibacillus koreensis]|uniref:GNAT family N-acetyltransferase n=1 Tax=Aquibacillus koreensis TaxID=279446 RepID=A0A9X3WHL8_9BACI|nr:GNAT family N-acetyltransferase [Aquibacillus koreensis]MCT2537132.1 GNAT family N-acetyltransferase [Aquibacillus koreensis]MDC3419885.1 GNAT family N-acetyltransferase [Aquibacillus koreensis]